jgi:two-component system CheB/CheR fusion protein
MNFKIICEGIEREEQVAKLRALNCDIAQGNYFYRPLSQSLFETLLDDALLPTVY